MTRTLSLSLRLRLSGQICREIAHIRLLSYNVFTTEMQILNAKFKCRNNAGLSTSEPTIQVSASFVITYDVMLAMPYDYAGPF